MCAPRGVFVVMMMIVAHLLMCVCVCFMFLREFLLPGNSSNELRSEETVLMKAQKNHALSSAIASDFKKSRLIALALFPQTPQCLKMDQVGQRSLPLCSLCQTTEAISVNLLYLQFSRPFPQNSD